MHIVKRLVFFTVLLLLQVTFFSKFPLASVIPDVLFVGVVVLCLRVSPNESLFWAFLCGLYLDVTMHAPFLFSTLFYFSIPFILHYVKTNIFSNQFLLGVLSVIVGSMIYYLIYYFIIVFSLQHYSLENYLNQLFLPVLLYNLALLLILYPLSRMLVATEKQVMDL
ncbi:MAG: rod shape-determining protein MreD [bacterium]